MPCTICTSCGRSTCRPTSTAGGVLCRRCRDGDGRAPDPGEHVDGRDAGRGELAGGGD